MLNPIIARVELHERLDAKPDYTVLRQNMARWKFSHFLWIDGDWKLLPTGTYARTEDCPIDLAKDMVQFAADLTGFANCGVVSGDDGLRFFELKKVQQSGHLLMGTLPAPSRTRLASLAPPPPALRGLYGTRK